MTHVALIHQPYRPETAQSAREAGGWLDTNGHAWELLSAFDLEPHDPRRFELALSFGGDGTTLRAARWATGAGPPCGVTALPVAPVGMGTLSFLAELGPSEVSTALGPYLGGDYWRDERAMLAVEVNGARAVALNDIVVARGASLRAVSIDLAVHGHDVTRFTADGLVLSTATGSTAYALAAGGPVLAPELRDVVVVPIAGHLSALGSLVLPETAEIRLTVVKSQPAVLSADGQVDFELAVGQSVFVRVAEERTVFARRGNPRDFYAQLTARLHRS